jgi:hypothetical protein
MGRVVVVWLAVLVAMVTMLSAVVQGRMERLAPDERMALLAELAEMAGFDDATPETARRVVAGWIFGIGALAVTPGVVFGLFLASRAPKKRDREDVERRVASEREGSPPPRTPPRTPSRRSLRGALPVVDVPAPPALVTMCIAVPSARREVVEARLRAAASVHALLAETVAHEVASRDGEALVWLDLAAPSADAPTPDATVAGHALDALARRDTPHHDGGFRDAATLRSTRDPGHAVLAITIVARDVVLRPGDLADRARLANAVGGLLPIAPEAVLHHAYRFVPDDAARAFDAATLRATFPELRPV